MYREHCRPRSAFTLIEILVVVVILGIAGAVIVPQLGDRGDLRLTAAARVVMADLIYAQNLAITQQSQQLALFTTLGQNYSILRSSDWAVVTHPVNKTPFTTRFGASGIEDVTLVSATFTGPSGTPSSILGFDELGTPVVRTTSGTTEAMTSGSIVLQSGSVRFRIDIEPYTGQVNGDFVP